MASMSPGESRGVHWVLSGLLMPVCGCVGNGGDSWVVPYVAKPKAAGISFFVFTPRKNLRRRMGSPNHGGHNNDGIDSDS